MRRYIRDKTKGGSYFFTINLYDRQSNLLTTHIEALRQAFKKTKQTQPFEFDACVVLPDHMHLIITLPLNKDNYKFIKEGRYTEDWGCDGKVNHFNVDYD